MTGTLLHLCAFFLFSISLHHTSESLLLLSSLLFHIATNTHPSHQQQLYYLNTNTLFSQFNTDTDTDTINSTHTHTVTEDTTRMIDRYIFARATSNFFLSSPLLNFVRSLLIISRPKSFLLKHFSFHLSLHLTLNLPSFT